MNRRSFLASAAGAGAALVSQAQSSRPNFVILYTDDQGFGDVGFNGAADARTPHLDSLAAAGVRFTDWYSNAPACSPSRASLLTGKYPQRTGVVEVLDSRAAFDVPGLREGEITLPGELKKLGYRSAAVGKWHLGSAAHSRPRPQGFDEFFGFFSGWTDFYSHRYYKQSGTAQIFHDLWHNDEEAWADPEYQTELLGRKAEEFLDRQSSSRPFLLYLAFGAPHYPMIAPRNYVERFPAAMDRDRRMHLAMVAAVDDAVGRLRGKLRQRGLEKNTVIFFQSDNGATQEVRAHHAAQPYRGGSNAPFRGFKAGLFEGGIRMPSCMVWPGRIPAGKTVTEPGAAMDILPTFLEWAGAKPSQAVDGMSVAQMVSAGGRSPHEAIFWEYVKQRAVRKGEWKLILNPPSVPGDEVKDALWLSNLKEDPGEKRNWSAEQPAKVRELRSLLDGWRPRIG